MPSSLSVKEKVNSFLSVYFYEIERLLNSNSSELSKIKFQSEEANTDEFAKVFFRDFIRKNNNLANSKISQVNFQDENGTKKILISEINDIVILDVLLPENLTDTQKREIAVAKSSIYTNPDLYLKIRGKDFERFESVELKSTKDNSIPGSSVQQVSPFEWVIFIQRKPDTIKVTTGYYLHSITEKLPFPDRSPRPQVAFNTLAAYNSTNRILNQDILTYTRNAKSEESKAKLLIDWQQFLAEEWFGIITKNDTGRVNEKWFNTTLRKFVIKLLEHVKKLNPKEIDNLIENLKRKI